MNDYEREQVDKICLAWWLIATGEAVNMIAGKGKNVMADFRDYGGVYSSEGNKPEIVSCKVDEIRYEIEWDFLYYAEDIFEHLNNDQRWVLIVKKFCEHQWQTRKGPPMNSRQLADYLNITYDQYRDRLRNAREKVLRIDKQLRPHAYFAVEGEK